MPSGRAVRCEDDRVSRRAAVDPSRLARWCADHLGSPPAEELFSSGHLSAVLGLRLVDGREVVIKVRPASTRIAACVEVQRRLFEAGYPCPRPLTGAVPFGGDVATAESYVRGGSELPGADDVAALFAQAFARLIQLAPSPAEVASLEPPPSWADWNHNGEGLWPRSEEDPAVVLNDVAGTTWIDEVGQQARDRLHAGGSEAVVGHCDWLAGNLRWAGDELLVVHDWDSMITEREAVLAGFAAALYPSAGADELATVEGTERFLAEYGHARGRVLSADELRQAWAAGLWTRAFDAKFQQASGQPVTSLTEDEARRRLRRC